MARSPTAYDSLVRRDIIRRVPRHMQSGRYWQDTIEGGEPSSNNDSRLELFLATDEIFANLRRRGR